MLFSKNTVLKRRRLKQNNAGAISEYNIKVMPKLIRISAAIAIIPLLLGTFRAELRICFPGYLGMLLYCILMMGVFSFPKMKKYSLAGLYLLFTGMFALVLYISIVCYPERYAASALSFFCVMPLLFIDKPWRLNGVEILFYVVHTVLAYVVKGPEIAGVDMVNCLVSAFLGMVCGNAVLDCQLDALEARRQLTIEKETDVLTGLANRRKLFDTIELLEKHSDGKPSAVLMLDIDHFKEINDLKGHAKGDECLRNFGELLSSFERSHSIRFYRYGGEEFVGLIYGGSEKDMELTAESLRETVLRNDATGVPLTISVGMAWRNEAENFSLERWIDKADKAAYEAKSRGRNSVVRYTPAMDKVSE